MGTKEYKRRIRIFIYTSEEDCASCCHIRIWSPFRLFSKRLYRFVRIPSLDAFRQMLFMPDVIYLRRNYHYFPFTDRLLKITSSKGVKTVMDIDDLITELPREHISYNYYDLNREKTIHFIRLMDFITVSNEELKNRLTPYNGNIYVLPNYLDSRIWDDKGRRFSGRQERGEQKIVIGYAGSRTHEYDFKLVTPAVKHMLSKYKGRVEFKFVGCIPRGLEDMDGVRFYARTTMPYLQYARFMKNCDFDFALAPLEDNAFNRCKSNIKFLEYSASRIPAIYSRTGPYKKEIHDGRTGIVVDNTTEAWIRAMERLIKEPVLMEDIASGAYEYVKANYMLSGNLDRWKDFYLKVRNCVQGGSKGVDFRYIRIYLPYLLHFELSKVYWNLRSRLTCFLNLRGKPGERRRGRKWKRTASLKR